MSPAPAADQAPERVRVFGGTLQSDRPLPGLPVAPSRDDGQFPFWTLRTTETAEVPSHSLDAVITGTMTYSSGPVVTLADRVAPPELVVSDTGRFGIDLGARTIAHLAPKSVDRAAVALDLIGVVLPYALHREGAWCVHASAVHTPAGVIVFVAPRGTGKSTLAAGCVQAGCALVADDVVVLRASPRGVMVTPAGVPLRLRAETARDVGLHASDHDAWGKVRIAGALASSEQPLAAVYLLSATSAAADVARVLRTARGAALALLTNGKITELLGGAAAGEALERCVALAATTPVYDLAVPRDLGRLPQIVRTLLSWHTASPSTPLPA